MLSFHYSVLWNKPAQAKCWLRLESEVETAMLGGHFRGTQELVKDSVRAPDYIGLGLLDRTELG